MGASATSGCCSEKGNEDGSLSIASNPKADLVHLKVTNDEERQLAVAAPRKEDPPAQATTASDSMMLVKLQGNWYREATGSRIGRIGKIVGSKDGKAAFAELEWDKSLMYVNSTEIRLADGGGGFEMELDGLPYRGEQLDGPPARLRWNDGDVWVMSDIFPTLQGIWQKEADSQVVGEIRGGIIVWDTGYKQDVNALLSQSSSGALLMEVEGTQLAGVVSPGPPQSVKWSNDEVWVKAQALVVS